MTFQLEAMCLCCLYWCTLDSAQHLFELTLQIEVVCVWFVLVNVTPMCLLVVAWVAVRGGDKGQGAGAVVHIGDLG